MKYLTPEVYAKLFSDITDLRRVMQLPFGVQHRTMTHNDAENHLKIFRSEFTELCLARSRVKILDGLVDGVVTLIQPLAHRGIRGYDLMMQEAHNLAFFINELMFQAEFLKMDFLGAWDEIHKSNMSKVCPTEEDLAKTQVYYSEKGIETTAQPTTGGWVVKVAKEVTIDGEVFPEGKFLKSVSYHKPDLTPFI